MTSGRVIGQAGHLRCMAAHMCLANTSTVHPKAFCVRGLGLTLAIYAGSTSTAGLQEGGFIGNKISSQFEMTWNLLSMQEDGNLVLYTVDRRVAWASNTDTKSSDAYTLEVRSLSSNI